MKAILCILISLVSLAASGQKKMMTYEEWNEAAKTNMRLLPAYGYKEKTVDQWEADKEFIEASLKIDTTHRKASEHMVELGWKYLYGDDIKTAMYRFNQAWLMDSTNENAYWGFGAIYSQFNDWDKALAMYDKGLSINPRSANIITDKATVYLGKYYSKPEEVSFKEAEKLFLRSLELDPARQATLYKLSCIYLAHGDCDKSVAYYKKCKQYGRGPVTDEFLNDLKKTCGKKAID